MTEKKLPPSKQPIKKDSKNKEKIPPPNTNKLDKTYTTNVGLGFELGNKKKLEIRNMCFDDGMYKKDRDILPLRDVKPQSTSFLFNYYEYTDKDLCFRPGVGNCNGGKTDKLSKPWHPQHIKYVNKTKIFA